VHKNRILKSNSIQISLVFVVDVKGKTEKGQVMIFIRVLIFSFLLRELKKHLSLHR
jgi:hypothetical protein